MGSIQPHPSTDTLDASFLESPIPSERQEEILTQVWGGWRRTYQTPEFFRPYFQYYTEQCRIAYQSHGSNLAIRTHRHITILASRIRDRLSRSDVYDFLEKCRWTSVPASRDSINASIDLTARLLYMLDIGEFQNGHSGRRPLLWVQGSLQDFVQEILSETNSLDDEGIKFETTFNVRRMVGIAGFKVELTSNLSDHLQFRDSDKTVKVFHHASFLEAHRKTSIYPSGLVDETLATLALFFPKGDKETEKWYKRQCNADELDESILRIPKIDRGIKEYRYWHDRLVILKTEFDESRPSTITQWWNDRRDVSQWYPLWVAISLTVLFGLVQSIEGALQVYKAYNP